MPVFRVEKNSNYTTMCNYHLRDQGLSLKGKGLLSMLLSLPDTWNYSVRGLSSITPDGVDGVLTALKELERLGYLERNQQRESNGRMGRAEYVIYEMPRKKPCSESPCTEKPYTVNPDIQMAKRYVEQWKKVKAENFGLLLWGDVGTGKFFVATCIANALLEQGIPVLMTNFSKILNQMGAMYSKERYRYIASFSNYSLLILDDLGIERSTEYALEQVYAVRGEPRSRFRTKPWTQC